MRKKIKFFNSIIDKSNYKEAIRYCRILATQEGQDLKVSMDMFNNIKNGKAKIYFYDDGTFEYKRLK